MEFMDVGERIANKAATMGSVAVFVIAGKIKTVGGNAKGFEETVNRGINRLLGIYDAGCPQEWIDTDLVAA